MKIMFLGTGAADWPIKPWENMTEFRRLSSAIIDDTLLIDPGPQVIESMTTYGKDPANVKYIINTHPHGDHFRVETVNALQELGAEFIEFSHGDVKEIGKYTVYAYRANHSTCEKAVHFIITDGEKTIFYGLDGAWLMFEEVQGIKTHKPDFAVFDATIGDVEGDYRIFEHNNLNMVLEMQKTLKPYIKQFSINHMARTLHTPQKQLEERMKPYDVIVAYDGLELEIQ